jgi:phosphoribosylamine--glycine ligase
VALSLHLDVDLVVVGPEQPLADGLADRLIAVGTPVMGPTAACARLETSKAFAKQFMAAHAIPTAAFVVCRSTTEALAAIDRVGIPVVVKADGLAAGKGVVVATTRDEALAAVAAAMDEHRFGAAGDVVVIEECLQGVEASFFALCDGVGACYLGSAQDHKRVFDDDRGPNTGGMGAFAPSSLIDDTTRDRVMRDVVAPVVEGMRAAGHPFAGVLFVGLMLTADGPKVIEFNVRFGDPETQVVLPLIGGELGDLLHQAATATLPGEPVAHLPGAAVAVVLASAGYPGAFTRGHVIRGLDAASATPGVHVIHAGTTRTASGEVLTDGGRVLAIVAEAPDHASAIRQAYAGVACVGFEGIQFRSDIGQKALVP